MRFETMLNRWWVYQRERFPILGHGPLIVAFSASALCFSSLLRGRVALPDPRTAVIAFASSFLFFLQLRIADEFKDYEEDARYRPYRPVPRGLVTLRELGFVGVAGTLVQFALALWLDPRLLLALLPVWLYLGLMTKEFFAREWLKARPFTYMWTHMLILPLIDFYATACDWLVAGAAPPRGLSWFLAASLCNGTVIEIGRKIRAPEDEEHGVETYSALWGRRNAALAWLGAMLLAMATSLLAATQVGPLAPLAALLALPLSAAALNAWQFLRRPATKHARRFEAISGVWTLLMYVGLGGLPLALGQ